MSDKAKSIASKKSSGQDERLQKVSKLRLLLNRPELGALGGAILVFIFFGIVAGDTGMFSAYGMLNFLDVSANLGIIAIAAAMLMIGGEFDLSIGSFDLKYGSPTFDKTSFGYPFPSSSIVIKALLFPF